MKIFQELWAHHNERKRQRFLNEVTPIVLAFMDEYGEPVRPLEGTPANNHDKVMK